MPRKQADYPDWVTKHKTKGTYINKVGDKYYLYAAHSERVKGTGKVKRVCDGYIGRITEDEGLIPARNSLKSPPESFEIGLSFAIIYMTSDIASGLRKSYRKNGELIYCCSILSFIYGTYSAGLYEGSYIGIRFPGMLIPTTPAPAIATGIERGLRMLEDTLSKRLSDDYKQFLALFPDIRLIKADGSYYLAGLKEEALGISERYGIKWEDQLWQR